MSLLRKANIPKRNIKSENLIDAGSSRRPVKVKVPLPRMDLFLIITLFILIITPFVINMVFKIRADIRLVNLYISPVFEDLFGKEMAENLLHEFNEANPDIRVRLFNNQDDREPDIIIFDEYDPINIVNVNIMEIPLVSFMDVLFYNIDILSAAGFDRPPRTRGEYLTYARTTADSGIYSDELTSPENNRPVYRKLEDFAQGRAAMIIASTRAIPSLREKMGDDSFSITSIPTAIDGSTGRYDINLTGIYAGIGVNCANPDEAWSFIEFLTEQRAVFCEMFKAVPGTASDVIPGDYVRSDPFYSKAWDIFEYNRITQDGLQF